MQFFISFTHFSFFFFHPNPNWGRWVHQVGHWVQRTESPLALLTSIQTHRKPPGTKDLECFHWLSPNLNTLPTPTLPEKPRSHRATFIQTVGPFTRLAAPPVCHLDPSQDWLRRCRSRAWRRAVAGLRGASTAGLETVLPSCRGRWNVLLSFRPNLSGQTTV